MKALIYNGVVYQISETEFPVSSSMAWVDIPKDQTAKFGYVYSGETFTEPPIPEPQPPTALEILQGRVIDLLDYACGNITQEDFKKKYSEILSDIKGVVGVTVS